MRGGRHCRETVIPAERRHPRKHVTLRLAHCIRVAIRLDSDHENWSPLRLTIDTFEAKTHLAGLLDRVAAGVQITITRHGTPIARLVPIQPSNPHQVCETIAKLKQFSKGQTLGGLKFKDLINEYRR
jgi:prevent-host-death family protein